MNILFRFFKNYLFNLCLRLVFTLCVSFSFACSLWENHDDEIIPRSHCVILFVHTSYTVILLYDVQQYNVSNMWKNALY